MRRRRLSAALIGPAAVIGLFACLSIQGPCFDVPTGDLGRPDPGTARADYCGAVDHWYRWLLFPLAAVLVAALVSTVLRRSPRARVWSLAVLLVLAVANVVVVSALHAFVND